MEAIPPRTVPVETVVEACSWVIELLSLRDYFEAKSSDTGSVAKALEERLVDTLFIILY
jgi:hypothetical protein